MPSLNLSTAILCASPYTARFAGLPLPEGKKDARRQARQALDRLSLMDKALASQSISSILKGLLDSLSCPASPGLVIAYVPGSTEPDFLDTLQTCGAAPGLAVGMVRIQDSGSMDAAAWDGNPQTLVPHARLPIREASAGLPDLPVPKDAQGLILVPGLAFDTQGGRLGKGRGYYDRYLAAHPGLFRLGMAFDTQVFPQVPLDSHDQILDGLLTQSELHCFGPRCNLDNQAVFSRIFQYLSNLRRS